MGTQNHTPDPAQGALIDAAGVIVLPDDNENMKADNIQLGDEQLADWIAYVKQQSNLGIANLNGQNARGIDTLTSGPATETIVYTTGTWLGPLLPTADIVAEMDTSGVPSGARMHVGRKDPGGSGRTLTINNGVGGPALATIGSGDIGWIEAEYDGSDWIVIGWGGATVVVTS